MLGNCVRVINYPFSGFTVQTNAKFCLSALEIVLSLFSHVGFESVKSQKDITTKREVGTERIPDWPFVFPESPIGNANQKVEFTREELRFFGFPAWSHPPTDSNRVVTVVGLYKFDCPLFVKKCIVIHERDDITVGKFGTLIPTVGKPAVLRVAVYHRV
jgi:hypothetical protein